MWLKRCQLCLRRTETGLCLSCWQQIPALEPSERSFVLQTAQHRPAHPHIAYAAYANPLRQMLFQVKYHGARELAYSLGVYLGQWYASHWPAPDLLVPVPLHPQRLAQRGYNQAEELARGIGEALDRPCRDALQRNLDTPALHTLSALERQQVLQQAFVLRPDHRLRARSRILLVDDIVTTGSTLIQAADSLQAISARLVSLSLARALLHDSGP